MLETLEDFCAGVFRPRTASAWHASFQSGIQWRWGNISVPLVARQKTRMGLLVRFLPHQTLDARKSMTSTYNYTWYWELDICVCTWWRYFGYSLLTSWHTFVSRVCVCALKMNHSHCGSKKLLLSVWHWSVHVTSHLRDMRCVLSELNCAWITMESASGNIYAYIFLKSTKCCKLWILFFFSYLCLTVKMWAS